MDVIFRRANGRRYAVVVVTDRKTQTMDPAPGFDEHIPHDLVHYVVEAELGLHAGVFGRAADGAGTFYPAAPSASPRERARERRKQRRREQALQRDPGKDAQMATSERLAALCDVAWRRRHGQRPDPSLWRAPTPISTEDSARIERVLVRLDRLAKVWEQLPPGGELSFVWPSLEPR